MNDVCSDFEQTLSLPWKVMGSIEGPVVNANVHTASAVLSVYECNNLLRPSFPSNSRNCFLEKYQVSKFQWVTLQYLQKLLLFRSWYTHI